MEYFRGLVFGGIRKHQKAEGVRKMSQKALKYSKQLNIHEDGVPRYKFSEVTSPVDLGAD